MIDSIKYLVYIFLGLCNVLMVYLVLLKQSVGSSSFLDWLAYFGCLLGVFLAAAGYHHMLFRMAHRQELQGLVLCLIILMIPAWLCGFIAEMFLIISKVLLKDKDWLVLMWHLITYLVSSCLIAPPLRYLCYLYPEVVRAFNPLALPDDDFKVTEEHLK